MADVGYNTQSYRMQNGGITARFIYDAPPPNSFLNLDNLESREEGSIASRLGLYPLTTDGVNNNFALSGGAVSLGRMQGIGTAYRYAATNGGNLYRGPGSGQGAFTLIGSLLSGSRCSMLPYRPANSSLPWTFFADPVTMLKDNGTLGTAENWGISPPTVPCLIAPAVSNLIDVELFDEADTSSFTLGNVAGGAITGRVSAKTNNTIVAGVNLVTVQNVPVNLSRTGGVVTATTVSGNHNFVSGMRVGISAGLDAWNMSSVIITVTSATQFTYSDSRSNASTGAVSAQPLASFQIGMSVVISDGGSTETVYITEVTTVGFVANFINAHISGLLLTGTYLSGTINPNTAATVTKPKVLNLSFTATQEDPNNNLIQLYILLSNPSGVREVRVMFDVGDGSFSQDFYFKSIIASVAQTAVSGAVTAASSQTGGVAQRAAGGVDVRTVGGDAPSLLPSDLPILQQLQPASLTPGGANPWSLFQARIGEFTAVGAAGGPNNSWNNVVAWRIQILTNPTMTTSFGVDDLVFVGGSDLDSFAGQAYDYRATFINLDTGGESTPTVEMIASDPSTFGAYFGAFLPVPLSVQRTAIQIQLPVSNDSQVTHVNLYRRGGSLTQAWYFVAQIAVGTTSYIDTISDSVIENNDQLDIDADPPVTAQLPKPLKTTLGATGQIGPGLVTLTLGTGAQVFAGQLLTLTVGNLTEQARVQSWIRIGGVTSVTLYLQFQYAPGSPHIPNTVNVSATTRPNVAMPLAALAFDQVFLAGDQNNPHVLYYSTVFKPETFPVENNIEIGTPDAPIMALVVIRGFLYVFTTKTVWQIFGGHGATPIPIATGVMHGLVSSWAWATSENIVYYESYDGIYAFSGSGSEYLTLNTEWIWTSRTETGQSPAFPNGIIPVLNPAQKANVFMAYGNHELFVAYQDTLGKTHRQIYHDQYRRWRPDDQGSGNITAMLFEQDTGQLIVGKDDDFLYIDRVNDYDSGGWSGGVETKNAIPINLLTPQLDLGVAKAFKVFNELTIDCLIPVGQTVTATAFFDSQATQVALGTLSGTGTRTQYQLNINSGLGQRSLNMGLNLTGSVIGQVIFFETHIRAVIEAEERTSFDSYKLDFGTASWKLFKQAWFVYAAPDANGIAMKVYADDALTPIYTFTLPQTPNITNPPTNRTSVKVRLPALKCRIIRLVGTSASPFQMYAEDTELEWKPLDASKGYAKMPIKT